MKGFNLLLLLCLFLPTLVCQAEMVDFTDTPNDNLPPEILIPQKQNPANHAVEIPYSFAKLTINKGPAQEVKLNHPLQPSARNVFSLIKTAEAFVQVDKLTVRNFEIICNKVNEAKRLSDLERLLSENNLQLLEQAANEGASEHVIIAMFQNMRPQPIYILDAVVDDDHATLSVTGQSSFGPMNGLIHLINTHGLWKIEHEEWYAGYPNYTEIYNPLSISVNKEHVRTQGLLSKYFRDYKIKKNILSLTKVPYTKQKEAFTFVFVMSKEKSGPKRSALTRFREAEGLIPKPRPYVHLLWTGLKKILRHQHLIKDTLPMDVSIAPFDDGFASGELNIILPKKRPKEVQFALLWAF